MKKQLLKTSLTIAIALVWFINGLFCKLLNLVQRHESIVSRILGESFAPVLTKTIGALEVLMAIWIISGTRSRLCTYSQIIIIATMNIIETIMVPDLLLYGRANLFPAAFLISVIFLNEYAFKKRSVSALQ
jgi:hypothetical protein